jgi:C-terminal processing protease CtpA/Prc
MKMASICSVMLFIASTALAQGGTPALPQQPAEIGERGSGQTQSTMERTAGQQRQRAERAANASSDNLESSSEQVRKETVNEAGNIQVPKGIIGVSLRILADRIGDRTSLYIAHVHPEGPAQQAGLKHGDEVVSVNGESVTGKTYEEVIRMIRGEAGTEVKLGVKREGEVREMPITRIPDEKLFKG